MKHPEPNRIAARPQMSTEACHIGGRLRAIDTSQLQEKSVDGASLVSRREVMLT
jgi:hypothetical protein